MKTASDYLVTFPYGSTEPPYSPSHRHQGDDRAMPKKTPVVVNGVTIGLSGSTGHSTGPHLHTQKVVNGEVVNPNHDGGFTVPQPTAVYMTGFRDDIGNYVRYRDGMGAQWSQFHLDSINVKVGDKLGENMSDTYNEGDRKNQNESFFGEDKGYFKEYVGKMSYKEATEKILGSPEYIAETRVNAGDIVNVADVSDWPQEPALLGWTWKRFWYDYASNKVKLGHEAGTAEFEPLGQEVYIKSKKG